MDPRLGEIVGACMAAAQGQLSLAQLPAVSTADLLALVDALHADMDRAEAERAAHVAEHGHAVACRSGCDYCCANLIVAYQPEAIRVAAWLAEPARREIRRGFEETYPGWWAEVGSDADRLQALHTRGEVDAAQALYDEVQRRHVPCAFLVAGRCAIYPVRPLVCRNTHAIDTSDRCRPSSSERPQAVAFPPLDQLVQVGSAVLKVLHQKDGGMAGAAALCHTVHHLLDSGATPETG